MVSRNESVKAAMNLKSEYEAIAVSDAQPHGGHLTSAAPAQSSSPSKLRLMSRFFIAITAVAALAFISIHRRDVADLSWNRFFAPSHAIIPGDLSSLCAELGGGYSYGCWNSDARDTDLCLICKSGRFRTVQRGRIPRAQSRQAVISSKQAVALSHIRSMKIPASIRGILSDMCAEMESNFFYGCWNSDARDTDLCLICKSGHFRTTLPNKVHLQSEKQAYEDLVRLEAVDPSKIIRGVLSDMCTEMDHAYTYGCWNSAASDTDLCLICKSGRFRQGVGKRVGITRD